MRKITSEDDLMPFGKYRGKSIKWIIENAPSYILWLDEEGIIEFPPSTVEKAGWEDANNNPPEDYFWQPD